MAIFSDISKIGFLNLSVLRICIGSFVVQVIFILSCSDPMIKPQEHNLNFVVTTWPTLFNVFFEVQRSKSHAPSMYFFGKIQTMSTKMLKFHEAVKATSQFIFCLKGYKNLRNLRVFWSKSEHMIVLLISVPSDIQQWKKVSISGSNPNSRILQPRTI